MDFARTSARFRIRRDGEAWRWETFDDQARLRQAGLAPTKSLAAASVILSRTQVVHSKVA